MTHLTPNFRLLLLVSGETRKLPTKDHHHDYHTGTLSLIIVHMQFAVLPAIPQMPSTSNKTSYSPLRCPLLSKVAAKGGFAKHNPNDLHWFHSPFKCCKKDSTHLTVPP